MRSINGRIPLILVCVVLCLGALLPIGASSMASVVSVFGQFGVVNTPVTTTDIATPSAPSAGKTTWYTKSGQLCYLNPAAVETCPAAGTGSVTNFSSGNLSPLFTTSVSNPTTTPALSFSLSNASANNVFAGPTSGGAAPPTFRALVAADLPANPRTRAIGATFGVVTTGAPLLTSSTVIYDTIPFACTISKWYVTVDTGTIQYDVWKIATGTAIPTVANTIVAAAPPILSANTAANSSTLTGWTTSVSAGDIFGFNINTVSGVTASSLVLECDQ